MTAPVGRTHFQVENLGYESSGDESVAEGPRYSWRCNDCRAPRSWWAFAWRGVVDGTAAASGVPRVAVRQSRPSRTAAAGGLLAAVLASAEACPPSPPPPPDCHAGTVPQWRPDPNIPGAGYWACVVPKKGAPK